MCAKPQPEWLGSQHAGEGGSTPGPTATRCAAANKKVTSLSRHLRASHTTGEQSLYRAVPWGRETEQPTSTVGDVLRKQTPDSVPHGPSLGRAGGSLRAPASRAMPAAGFPTETDSFWAVTGAVASPSQETAARTPEGPCSPRMMACRLSPLNPGER